MVTVRYSTTVFLYSKWHNNGGYEEGHASHGSGASDFKTLRSLVSPASVDDKTYKQLGEELQKFYSPKPSEIVQRFKFNSRCRQPTESVAAFVTELRALAKHCNYHADSLDSLLRDRLVCGINDTQMQRRLLSEETLLFDNAF